MGAGASWRMVPHDFPPWEAVYQQTRRWIELPGPSRQWSTTSEQDRARVEEPAEVAEEHGIRLEVVKRPEAKRGFVLLPSRWVVERDFAWASRFRRLVKDYERLPATVAGLHFVALAGIFLHRAIPVLGSSP